MENIAIVKFDPNLHLGPKKRIFDIVNSKDRNDLTCYLSAVFLSFFVLFAKMVSEKREKNEFFKFSKAAVEPFPKGQVSTMTRKELNVGCFFFL